MDRGLPEELLSSIVEYLRLPPAHEIASSREWQHATSEWTKDDFALKENIQTLANISRSSKALYRITEPILYAVFPGQYMVNTRLWLAALVANSHRTSLVQELVIDVEMHKHYPGEPPAFYHGRDGDGSLYTSEHWPDGVVQFSVGSSTDDQHSFPLENSSVEPLYKGSLPALQLRAADETMYSEDLRAVTELLVIGHPEAVLATIFLITPNISAVDLSWREPLIDSLFDVAINCRDGAWQHLRRLDVRASSKWEGPIPWATERLEWVVVYPMMRAPNLNFLSVQNMALAGFPGEAGEDWPEREAQLKTLHLHNATIYPSELVEALTTWPSISSVKLSSGEDCDFLDGPLTNIKGIGNAIRQEGKNIQHLTLFGESTHLAFHELPRSADSWNEEEKAGHSQGCGDLQTMKHLKTLDSTLWELLGAIIAFPEDDEDKTHLDSILPDSLERLTLRWPKLDYRCAPDWDRLAGIYVQETSRLLSNERFRSLQHVQVFTKRAFATDLGIFHFRAPKWTQHMQASETGGRMYTFTRDLRELA